MIHYDEQVLEHIIQSEFGYDCPTALSYIDVKSAKQNGQLFKAQVITSRSGYAGLMDELFNSLSNDEVGSYTEILVQFRARTASVSELHPILDIFCPYSKISSIGYIDDRNLPDNSYRLTILYFTPIRNLNKYRN